MTLDKYTAAARFLFGILLAVVDLNQKNKMQLFLSQLSFLESPRDFLVLSSGAGVLGMLTVYLLRVSRVFSIVSDLFCTCFSHILISTGWTKLCVPIWVRYPGSLQAVTDVIHDIRRILVATCLIMFFGVGMMDGMLWHDMTWSQDQELRCDKGWFQQITSSVSLLTLLCWKHSDYWAVRSFTLVVVNSNLYFVGRERWDTFVSKNISRCICWCYCRLHPTCGSSRSKSNHISKALTILQLFRNRLKMKPNRQKNVKETRALFNWSDRPP